MNKKAVIMTIKDIGVFILFISFIGLASLGFSIIFDINIGVGLVITLVIVLILVIVYSCYKSNLQSIQKQSIRNCPYCGGEAKLEIGSASNGLGEEWYKTYDIICENVLCIAHPDCPKVYEDKEECIQAWNRRVGND